MFSTPPFSDCIDDGTRKRLVPNRIQVRDGDLHAALQTARKHWNEFDTSEGARYAL